LSVKDLKLGEIGTIREITGNNSLAKRLLCLGFVRGSQIKIISVAPMKDPILLRLKGFNIALRRDDCSRILLN
jgi:ferrous iron transport protein A